MYNIATSQLFTYCIEQNLTNSTIPHTPLLPYFYDNFVNQFTSLKYLILGFLFKCKFRTVKFRMVIWSS